MAKGYTYTKTEARRFLKRTKSGLNKLYNSDIGFSSNKFVAMANDIDRIIKKLK